MPTSETVNKHPQRPVYVDPFRRAFSFHVLLGATLVLGVILVTTAAGPGRLFVEGDVWWHAATGRLILSSGHVPTVDPYSFTVHGNPWMAYEWLGEVVMALAARMHSLQGLQVLLALLSAMLVVLTYCYAWVRTNNPLASAAAVALLLHDRRHCVDEVDRAVKVHADHEMQPAFAAGGAGRLRQLASARPAQDSRGARQEPARRIHHRGAMSR